MTDSLDRASALIVEAFEQYDRQFDAISRRTRRAFESRAWQEVQAAAVERIDLYDRSINQTRWLLHGLLGERVHEPSVWSELREVFGSSIARLVDRELHKTYFNSLSRRTFGTQGVNSAIEFVDIEDHPTRGVAPTDRVRRYALDDLTTAAHQVLTDYQLRCPYADRNGCGDFLARRMAQSVDDPASAGELSLLEDLFFRGTRAFAVGRLTHNDRLIPVMIAFAHSDSGVVVDAVLTTPSEISMLFGFTRSYFHADLEYVADTVAYLSPLMPDKPVGEIYTVLGRAKQGKTERYRELMRNMKESDDLMIVAPGSKGMVMAVFTLPSIDLVFKVIRDRFAYPKTVVRQEVLDSYDLVFKHDRAGRLVDAQEFRRLKFPRARFSSEVLKELGSECRNSVTISKSEVVIHHLYVERRINPLNLYLKDLTPKQSAAVVEEYGQAIRDLAMSDIFPGDLLLKNFGVTRHGRVVFYDYDELCLVTDCNFRSIPKARHDIEELSDETWFNVGPNDIFPEQFESFLGLPAPLLEEFKRVHGELLTPRYWCDIQAQLREGHVIDFPHYAGSRLSA